MEVHNLDNLLTASEIPSRTFPINKIIGVFHHQCFWALPSWQVFSNCKPFHADQHISVPDCKKQSHEKYKSVIRRLFFTLTQIHTPLRISLQVHTKTLSWKWKYYFPTSTHEVMIVGDCCQSSGMKILNNLISLMVLDQSDGKHRLYP